MGFINFLTIPPAHWRPHQINPVLIRNHPLARGLKFAEVFHEGKGKSPRDRVRPLLHGDIEFATTSWQATGLGTALEIDSTFLNNATTWNPAANYYSTLSEFTVEMIVKHNSLGEGGYYNVSFGGGIDFAAAEGNVFDNPVWTMSLNWAPGGQTIWGAYGSSTVFVPVPTLGRWYQYIVTKPAAVGVATLYINGLNADSIISHVSDQPAAVSVSGGSIRMFGGLFGSKPHRTAASFRVWDRALTAIEATQLFIDPWIIYEEAQSYRRIAARFFAAIVKQQVTGDAIVDGDNVSEGGGAIVANFQIVGASVVDGDAVSSGGEITEKGLVAGAGLVDGDAVGGAGLISIAAEPEVEGIPSVDIGGSRDEVFVQVIVANGAEFVIECSQDDHEFFAATPTLSANTFYQCDRIVPYWRVRKTNRLGSLLSYWGPQEGRIDGHEKGVVGPRIRYSDEDKRTAH